MMFRNLLRHETVCPPLLWVLLLAHTAVSAQEPAVEGNAPTSAMEAASQIEAALVEAVAKAEKSVVAIARIRKDDAAPGPIGPATFPDGLGLSLAGPTSPDFIPREFGAGVIIDKRGLVLTTLHVLGEVSGSEYVVWVQRRPYVAKVKAADPWLDVAVLEIAADDLVPIELGDSKSLTKGQLAVVLGNPLAIARDGEASASWGVIANLARQAPPNPASRARGGRETLHHYATLIQIDARSSLGNSGGAVVDLQGELVGLSTTLTSLPGDAQEAGFAIPIDADFKKALESLKQGRLPEYGFLGIAPQSLSLLDRQAGKQGVVVEDVVPGTPAAKAGLKPGEVIVEVNGSPVRDDLHLIRLVSALPAEEEVTLQVQRPPRATTPREVKVVLSKKYQESAREAHMEQQVPAWRGMRVEYATAAPAFRDFVRHIDPEGCVAVIDVQRDSPAWKAGLRAGQFITHVNSTRVSTPTEFHAAVAEATDTVSMRVTTSPDGELTRSVEAP